MTDKEKLIPQFELGPRLGGIKELGTRLSFYNGIANSIMVAGIFYTQNPHLPFVGNIQEVIPNIGAFYLSLVLFASLLAIWEHVVVIPAQAAYNQRQDFNPERSPIRQEVQEVQEDVEDIKREVQDDG